MRTFKRIAGVLLIFIFGVIVGGASAGGAAWKKMRHVLEGGPDAVINVIVKRLDHDLKLDDEQRRKLQSIVDDTHIQLRQIRAKTEPETRQALSDAEARVRAILYPEQVTKFDELLRKNVESWKPKEPKK